jgi:FdhE protein
MPTPIITDGAMDKMIKAPRVVPPSAGSQLFADRAARFDALGGSGEEGAYLRFLGHVCRAQHKAMGQRQAQSIAHAALANSREHGMPPLSAHVFPRDASWRSDLRDILGSLGATMTVANERIEAVMARLRDLLDDEPAAIEAMADRCIAGISTPDDGPCVPFIGAALQVYFTRMAATIAATDVGVCDVAAVCPCCGMRPTASVLRIDPERMNYRYLVCSLCMTEWNLERVKCSSCEEEKGIAYLSIEEEGKAPADAVVRAETCDECKTYLKIMLAEKDPLVDAIADDLATLALDLLVDERGYARTGPNLLFYPGGD